MKEVLDTRFFAAHYASRDADILEWTRSKISALRRERRGLVPSIVVAEVAHFLCAKAGRRAALAQIRAIAQSGLELVPLGSEIAGQAGMTKCAHRDVPIADCIIAATALRADACVVSDDDHFRRIKGLRVIWI